MGNYVCLRKAGRIMSKIYDCPQCGEHNCVSDNAYFNYCMYCGNPVNGNWHYAYNNKFEKKESEPQQSHKTGQMNLFDINNYKKPQAWNGG